jgi:copper chaperone CopZ
MYEYQVGIEGMMCGMCETHIADTIRKAVPDAKKVKASRRKKLAAFRTEQKLNETALRQSITNIGYTMTNVVARQ